MKVASDRSRGIVETVQHHAQFHGGASPGQFKKSSPSFRRRPRLLARRNRGW